ncbi:MAG: TIGR00341 family protein [Spirochaetes bacterium]|nr:TIGR00341 family protein [Spirochaetota bacterium]
MKFVSKLRSLILGEEPAPPAEDENQEEGETSKKEKPRGSRSAREGSEEEPAKGERRERGGREKGEWFSFWGEGMGNMFNRVVLPEERKFRNYINPAFWKEKRAEYRALREKEKIDLDVYRVLAEGAMPTIEYYVLTVISCVVATSGLIQGSTAVIIGAMIIAPLMTPILSFSIAILWGDLLIIRLAFKSLFNGVVLTIVLSSAIAYLFSMPDYSQEIMSRTVPSAFDIIVALASGVVGAYGYANKKISATLVGIAIAVALMPPLCVIGIGLGTMNLAVAGGAALLFAINLVSISLAGAVVFWIMKIHPLESDDAVVRKRALSHIVFSMTILTAIAIPVGFYMREGYLVARAKKSAVEVIHEKLTEFSVMEIRRVKEDGRQRMVITVTGEETPEGERIKETAELIIKKAPSTDKISIRFIQSSQLIY